MSPLIAPSKSFNFCMMWATQEEAEEFRIHFLAFPVDTERFRSRVKRFCVTVGRVASAFVVMLAAVVWARNVSLRSCPRVFSLC